MPTHLLMLNRISVDVMLVSGTHQHILDRTEMTRIRSQVNKALRFLAAAEPRADLSFKTHFHSIKLPEQSGHQDSWQSQALSHMGYKQSADLSFKTLNEDDSSAAFTVFISKMPMEHFAYAEDTAINLSFYSGGFGLKNMHALLVHEICHVFGAADEIGDCECHQLHGYYQIKNGNCHICHTETVPCIMAADDLALCPWTRKQIGWVFPDLC